MNQITVSLSHNREFNHAAAPRVSAPVWLHLDSKEISSQPSETGVLQSLGKGSRHWCAWPLVPKSQLPLNITSVRNGRHRLGSALHAMAI